MNDGTRRLRDAAPSGPSIEVATPAFTPFDPPTLTPTPTASAAPIVNVETSARAVVLDMTAIV
jgi:hypothetical protein